MKFCFHKYGIPLIAGLCCVFSSAIAGEVPPGFPVERYSPLWEHSPFTISSVQQDAAPAGFAQNLAVVGIARIGDQDIVTLLNKQSLERITATSSGPNKQGMKVVLVAADADPLKTSVTIQMGSEVARVGFDKGLLAQTQSQPQQMANAPVQVFPNGGQPPNFSGQNAPPIPATRIRRLPPVPTLNPAPPGSAPPVPSQ